MDKLKVKDNARGQFQIRLTTADGTITCVVAVSDPDRYELRAQRHTIAMQLAKRLAQRLDSEIKVTPIGTTASDAGVLQAVIPRQRSS